MTRIHEALAGRAKPLTEPAFPHDTTVRAEVVPF